MKTAVVTGTTGCIGRHVKEQLLLDGWNVVSLGRRDCTSIYDIGTLVPEGTEAIFHCAGTTSGDFEADNIALTKRMLAVAKACKVERFIFTSTGATYAPESCKYAHSKWVAENLVRTSGLDYVILQPCVVIGRYDRKHYSELFKRKCIVFPGSMEFCWAEDIARAHLMAYERGKSGESYLLSGVYAPWLEFAREVATVRGDRQPTRPMPLWWLYVLSGMMKAASIFTRKPSPLTPSVIRLITSGLPCPDDLKLKTENDLGYAPSTTLKHMIHDCYEWMKQENML